MVPNSLGPGELLMRFGTEAQQQHWLPRLADGTRHSLLRPDQPGSGLRRRLDGRHRHHLQGRRSKAARCWACGSTGTSATSRSARSRRCSVSPSRPMIPITSWAQQEELGITRRADPDRSARRRDRPAPSAVDAGVPERPELGPRRLHPARLHHRRPGAARAGLEDADDGARRRPRHLAAVAVGGGCGLCRAHHRRLCPHPRAVRHFDRQVRGHRGAARRASPAPPICSTRRGG